MKDENGQVGVIGAILLIGVALILVSYFVTYQIPDMVRNNERSHTSEIVRVFSDIHEGLASQIASMRVGTIYPVSFPIGSGSGSLFGFGGVSGTLSIGNEKFYVNSTSSLVANSSIVYEAPFTQLIPQVYSYEMGGVILRQGDRSLMKSDPIITVERDISKVTVNMTMVSLSTMEISSRSGTMSATINFFIDYVMPVNFGKEDQKTGNVIFDFHTSNAEAWRRHFEDILQTVGEEFYTFDESFNTPGRFHMMLKNVDLENSTINYAIVRVSLGG